MDGHDRSREIREIVIGLSDNAKVLLQNALQAEKEKLHMQKPRGIVQDLEDEVKRLIP